MHWAAAEGNIGIYEILQKDFAASASWTHTFYTCSRQITLNIREKGVNAPDSAMHSFYTPLHWAAIRGQVGVPSVGSHAFPYFPVFPRISALADGPCCDPWEEEGEGGEDEDEE